MKGIIAIIVGLVGAIAFAVGWAFDPGSKATLVISLVCGFATVLGQLSTRDLMSRAQGLIDRGADENASDGGELYAEARRMKDRIEKIIMLALIAGVLATFFAALRVISEKPYWTGAALALSSCALVISGGLFFANRSLGDLIDRDRLRRANDKTRRTVLEEKKPFNEADYAGHPNLKGYGSDKPDASHLV